MGRTDRCFMLWMEPIAIQPIRNVDTVVSRGKVAKLAPLRAWKLLGVQAIVTKRVKCMRMIALAICGG